MTKKKKMENIIYNEYLTNYIFVVIQTPSQNYYDFLEKDITLRKILEHFKLQNISLYNRGNLITNNIKMNKKYNKIFF